MRKELFVVDRSIKPDGGTTAFIDAHNAAHSRTRHGKVVRLIMEKRRRGLLERSDQMLKNGIA